MELECQAILRPQDKIWIGDQTKPIPEGTFDRIYRAYGPYTSQEYIVLRQNPKGKKRIKKEMYDLSETSIYIEHRPFPTYNFTDSKVESVSLKNCKDWRTVDYPASLPSDNLAPNFSLTGKKPPRGSDECRVALSKDLVDVGIYEFNILDRDRTLLDKCTVEELRCLVINPQRDMVIICYTDKEGNPAYASVKPSQVENIAWERLRIY